VRPLKALAHGTCKAARSVGGAPSLAALRAVSLETREVGPNTRICVGSPCSCYTSTMAAGEVDEEEGEEEEVVVEEEEDGAGGWRGGGGGGGGS